MPPASAAFIRPISPRRSLCKRRWERGYFILVGLPLVLLFPPNTIRFDQDLLAATQRGLGVPLSPRPKHGYCHLSDHKFLVLSCILFFRFWSCGSRSARSSSDSLSMSQYPIDVIVFMHHDTRFPSFKSFRDFFPLEIGVFDVTSLGRETSALRVGIDKHPSKALTYSSWGDESVGLINTLMSPFNLTVF